MFGFTAFVNPILDEFGWSATSIAVAISIQRTEAGIAGPFVGILIDRFGARLVILAGTIVTAAGFLMLARIDQLIDFYIAFGVIALGISMGTFIATTAAVNNWFIRYRSRALAIAFTGPGLSGIIVPFLVFLIENHGWRTTLDVVGIGTLLVGLPVVCVMRFRPEDYGEIPDGVREKSTAEVSPEAPGKQDHEEINLNLRQALHSIAFWQLMLAMGLTGTAMGTVTVFAIPAMESYGISTTTAGFAVLLLTVVSLSGRWGLGFLGDIVEKRYVLAFSFLLIALGTLAFALIGTVWHLVFFLLLYSPGHGGSIPVRFALMGDYFGRKSYGTILGVTMTIGALFGVAGPVFVGWMFDQTGSYRLAFVVIAILGLLAVPIAAIAKKPKNPAIT
jgi:MFS family permease